MYRSNALDLYLNITRFKFRLGLLALFPKDIAGFLQSLQVNVRQDIILKQIETTSSRIIRMLFDAI
jgi:hypothetical protein